MSSDKDVVNLFSFKRKKRKRIPNGVLPLHIKFEFEGVECDIELPVTFTYQQETDLYLGVVSFSWDMLVSQNPELNKPLILRKFSYFILGEELTGNAQGFTGLNFIEPGKNIHINLKVNIKEGIFNVALKKVSENDMQGSLWGELQSEEEQD